MNRSTSVLFLLGAAAAWLFYNRQDIEAGAQSVAENVQAALTGWKSVNQGPVWVPVLNDAETRYGLPQDLLARMAYRESVHFRQDVIEGSTASPAGALGLMQLMPRWFTTVQGPRPFTPDQTAAQIDQAAQLLKSLFSHYGDWTLAVAAYNDGQGNIDAYLAGNRALPQETRSYVADMTANIPISGVLA